MTDTIFIQNDEQAMQLALQQAQQGLFIATPNPRVGCVLVKDQRVIGVGSTQAPGGHHAEIQALEDARKKGQDVRGATVYVTLEPCHHFGLTPPCVDALITAGVGKVVAALGDPNPLVAGQGLQRLQAAGIEVVSGLLQDQAYDINIGFFTRMQRGVPWVRAKVAASLDGKTALDNGQSQWITGQPARNDGHAWRARACAIMTGIGTVQYDNPQLTVRAITTPRQPRRIIVDSNLALAPSARILEGDSSWIFTANDDPAKIAALEKSGAEVIVLPSADNKVDLRGLLYELGRRQINEVHVEAGSRLTAALIRLGCVDELLLYIAPSLLGKGRDMCDLPPLNNLDDRILLYFHEVKQLGADLRILARLVRA